MATIPIDVVAEIELPVEGSCMIAQILGHYRILEKLGAGGRGIVCRADGANRQIPQTENNAKSKTLSATIESK
jgi:hypothetical protein